MGSPTGKQILCLEGQRPVLFPAEQSNRVHGKCPLFTTACKEALAPLPSTPGKQAALVREPLRCPQALEGTWYPAWSETKLSCGMLDTERDPVLPACPGNGLLWCAGLPFSLQAWGESP